MTAVGTGLEVVITAAVPDATSAAVVIIPVTTVMVMEIPDTVPGNTPIVIIGEIFRIPCRLIRGITRNYLTRSFIRT